MPPAVCTYAYCVNGCVSKLGRGCNRVCDNSHNLASSSCSLYVMLQAHWTASCSTHGHLHREGATVGWQRTASVVVKELITRSSSFLLLSIGLPNEGPLEETGLPHCPITVVLPLHIRACPSPTHLIDCIALGCRHLQSTLDWLRYSP